MSCERGKKSLLCHVVNVLCCSLTIIKFIISQWIMKCMKFCLNSKIIQKTNIPQHIYLIFYFISLKLYRINNISINLDKRSKFMLYQHSII